MTVLLGRQHSPDKETRLKPCKGDSCQPDTKRAKGTNCIVTLLLYRLCLRMSIYCVCVW